MIRRIDAELSSLWLIFFLNGVVLASWAPRIPDVKDELDISDGVLGVALFGVAAGSVPALFATGALMRRVTPRTVCRGAAISLAAGLPLIALAQNGIQLTLALAVLGAANGCLDVAMNATGIRYEEHRHARVLSRLHGGFSLGVLTGASFGALAAALQVAVGLHFGIVAGLLIIVALAISSRLPDYGPSRTTPAAIGERRRSIRVPLPIVALAVAALLVEGMITDWSALLVGRDYGGGASLGALTVTCFSFAMFVSRSIGDVLVQWVGTGRLIFAGTLLLVTAMAIGLAQPSPIGALIGIMLMSFVIGPLFPIAISATGSTGPTDAAAMVAKVSAIGYLAFLCGPPLVGIGAEALSLPTTFVLITLACAASIGLGGRYLPQGNRTTLDQPTPEPAEPRLD